MLNLVFGKDDDRTLDGKSAIEDRLPDPPREELRLRVRHIAPSELRFTLREKRAI